MSIINRIRWGIVRALASNKGIAFIPSWGQATLVAPAYNALIAQGYKRNGIVGICAGTLALSFSEPPLVAIRNDTPQPGSPLGSLLAAPNLDQNQAEFMACIILYASLGGNCYIWKERSASGRPVGLWPLHDGQIEPVLGRSTAEGYIRYYSLTAGPDSNPWGVEGYDATIKGTAIPKGDIIHYKWLPDPSSPGVGVGALQQAWAQVASDNEIQRYILALLRNDAMPRTIINLAPGDPADPDAIERLKQQFIDKYGGDNKGAPAFLEAGMTVQRLALDMDQLALPTLYTIPETRIAAAFRVPPIIAGLQTGLDRSTFSNYAEARAAFAEDTLAPLWRFLGAELQQSLAPDYGPGWQILVDTSQVKALQENEAEIWGRATAAWQGGLATRAEARAMVGLPEGPADQVYMWPGAGQVAPYDQIPEPPGAGLLGIMAGPRPQAPLLLPDLAQPEPGANGHQKGPASLGETKSRLSRSVDALRAIRDSLQGRMEADIDRAFQQIGARAVERLRQLPQAAGANGAQATKQGGLPEADDLIRPEDGEIIRAIFEKYLIEIVATSWQLWDMMLNISTQFDYNDPIVTQLLAGAGEHIRGILEQTRQHVADTLQYGNDQGWSIDQLVRGDIEAGYPGLRDLITETYKNRARAVARTELGTAQNKAATQRYQAAGVAHVMIFDNGFDNSHPFCTRANGKVVDLAWAEAYPLQHPNCVRAFGPLFNYQGPVFTEVVPWGAAG